MTPALHLLLSFAAVAAPPSERSPEALSQTRVIQLVRQAGGVIQFDFEYQVPLHRPRSLADDWQSNVVCVEMDAADAGGRQLVDFKKIDDAFASTLCDLPHLRKLRLPKSSITDKTMGKLSALARLEVLDLAGTSITDEGVHHLSKVTHITHLHLSGTLITDRAIKSIRHLRSMDLLFLDGTDITDASLSDIAAFDHLRVLDLSQTKVTEKGLEYILTNCKNLTHVDITSANVDAQAIRTLRGMFPAVTITATAIDRNRKPLKQK